MTHSAAVPTSWFGRGLFRGPPLRHARADFSGSNLDLQRWLAKGKLLTRTRRMASDREHALGVILLQIVVVLNLCRSELAVADLDHPTCRPSLYTYFSANDAWS
jgi:hypothetical protein